MHKTTVIKLPSTHRLFLITISCHCHHQSKHCGINCPLSGHGIIANLIFQHNYRKNVLMIPVEQQYKHVWFTLPRAEANKIKHSMTSAGVNMRHLSFITMKKLNKQ